MAMANAQRKVWIIEGDMYFSPNSLRNPGKPPDPEAVAVFAPEYTRATDFQSPSWWSGGTEWLGFVPQNPVGYSSPWFDSLAILPGELFYKERVGYGLPPTLREKWHAIEDVLVKATRHLALRNKLMVRWPFQPTKLGYAEPHETSALASDSIECSRDWFSLWIGLLFWMAKKIPEEDGFIKDLMPPKWFVMLVQHTQKQAIMDNIRTAPLLQTIWKISRVGLWLRSPSDGGAENQPPVQWFINQGVPVWYRWGRDEMQNSHKMWIKGFLAPYPDEIQAATTWITPTVTHHSQYEAEYFDNTSLVTPDFDPSPMSPTGSHDFSGTCASPTGAGLGIERPTPPPLVLNFDKERKSGKHVWGPWFEQREKDRKWRLSRETPSEREVRRNRERVPPTARAQVYIWDWNLEIPPQFVREVVLRDHRKETLASYNDEQKRYDSVFNEWDCCEEWGPTVYSPDTVEFWTKKKPDSSNAASPEVVGHLNSSPSLQAGAAPVTIPSDPLTTTHAAYEHENSPPPSTTCSSSLQAFAYTEPSEGFRLERAHYEVLDLLCSWFGFVRPIPFPGPGEEFSVSSENRTRNTATPISEKQMKEVVQILGLPGLDSGSAFLRTPVGRVCANFTLLFSTKPVVKPNRDIWDLCEDSWKTLWYNPRLSSVCTVRNERTALYMFDFGAQSTTPWKLAVYTATAAMYVCRLPSKWDEREIAMELAQCGIPFRTLQDRTTLPTLPPEKFHSVMVPMRLSGHVFDNRDAEFYLDQRERLLALKRSRAALLRGGFVRRVAIANISISEAARGPWGIWDDPTLMFTVKNSTGVEYVDDELTDVELDVLCGVYMTFTGVGSQVMNVSWYPAVNVYERPASNPGRWTGHLEELYTKFSSALSSSEPALKNATQWRSFIKLQPVSRKAVPQLEAWAEEVLLSQVGGL